MRDPFQPLVLGPDGRLSYTTPTATTTTWTTPPRYFTGTSRVSDFVADMLNDMLNSVLFTPEPIVTGFDPSLPDGGLETPDFDRLADEFARRMKEAADKAARDAVNKPDTESSTPEESTGIGQPR